MEYIITYEHLVQIVGILFGCLLYVGIFLVLFVMKYRRMQRLNQESSTKIAKLERKLLKIKKKLKKTKRIKIPDKQVEEEILQEPPSDWEQMKF